MGGKKHGKTKAVPPPEEVIDNDRFDISKPQFRKPKETSTKIEIDDRFSSVMSDPRFQLDIKDKYGRKKKRKNKSERMEDFYTIESKDPKKENEEDDVEAEAVADDSHSQSRSDEGDKHEDPESRIAYLNALSRGELDVSSSDDESGDSDDQSKSGDESSDSDDELMRGKAGILDPSSRVDDVERTTEESHFLAVMNMDWSNIRAVDVFSMLSSFTPHGSVKRVEIYPSDFGIERMKHEEKFGPSGLWKDPEMAVSKLRKEGEEELENIEIGEEDSEQSGDENDDGFDEEKLREYEASRLKYYFAVAEFSNASVADIAYKEVDGLEFEYSSAAVDLRSIPVNEVESIIEGRPMKEKCTTIPSNYTPPEFVVSALQKSSVDCSWELGDRDRHRALTKYKSTEAWKELAEGDEFDAYLASDNSSDEEEENGNEKASRMRQMLGLADSDDDNKALSGRDESDDSSAEESDEGHGKSAEFVPGETNVAQKIKEKLQASNEQTEDLTPWEKYKAKRKEKRALKRKESRERRKEVRDIRSGKGSTRAKDSFFGSGDSDGSGGQNEAAADQVQTREQLELLVAGDDEAADRDFDMRGLQRIEKNKSKTLRGSRKRKEEKITADVAGADFKLNVEDNRFKAVLDGDNQLFGIDRTNPNFKETQAMNAILKEQTRRRKDKKRKKSSQQTAPPDVSADSVNTGSTGASKLSALVSSIKSKVGNGR